MESQAARRGSRASFGVLLLALGFYALGAWSQRFLIDDAFISFRYARNWADGLGLRYNPGVHPPVEGYSNFLWMATLSLGYRLGLPLEVTSQILSVLSGGLLLTFAHRWLLRRGVGVLALASCDLVIATSGAMWVWATSGLETMPFTAVFCVLFLSWIDFAERPAKRGAVRLGLLALTLALLRVEGVLWALSFPVLTSLATANRSALVRRAIPYLVVLLAGSAIFLVFRYLHFEAWVPNTAHVKAGFSSAKLTRGWNTDASFLLTLTPLLLVGASLLASRGSAGPVARAIVAGLLALLAYNALVGGDWMPAYRFLAPFWVLGGIGLAFAVAKLGRVRGGTLGACALVLGLLPSWDVHLVPESWRQSVYFRSFDGGYQTELERFRQTRTNGRNFERIGRLLGRVAQPGDSVAVGAIGAIGFYSRLFVHDRNGLVDRQVAQQAPVHAEATAGHEKRVPWSWFTERRPTYYEPIGVARGVPLRAAAASHGARVFRKDPALRDACIARKLVADPADDLALVVLAGVADPAEARRFWDRMLP